MLTAVSPPKFCVPLNKCSKSHFAFLFLFFHWAFSTFRHHLTHARCGSECEGRREEARWGLPSLVVFYLEKIQDKDGVKENQNCAAGGLVPGRKPKAALWETRGKMFGFNRAACGHMGNPSIYQEPVVLRSLGSHDQWRNVSRPQQPQNHQQLENWGLGRWPNGEEHFLYPHLSSSHQSCSIRESHAFFWPLWGPVYMWYM